MSYQAASPHNSFPPPLVIGSSIAAVTTDQIGSLGVFFRLFNPEKTRETTVILTSRRAIGEKGQYEDRGITIRSPSREDIEVLLPSE